MIRFFSLCVTLLVFAAPATAQPAPDGLTIHTESGDVSGASAADGVRVFKGIPYAAPPVGSLRWRAPQASPAWSAPLQAHDYGPSCPQNQNPPRFVPPSSRGFSTNEDCLYLNVWAPAHTARAPVMVWIHGGGNDSGTASQTFYSGQSFARDGIVMVSFNYRLGLLGFFAHPALTREAHAGEATNFGLLDQLAVLNWVKRNIAAFGGDPNNVTVFGESAGAEDVVTLMTMPSARGLFHRAIAESTGLGWDDPPTLAQAEATGAHIASTLGANDLAALRALPVDALLRAQNTDEIGVVTDGALIPQAPLVAFASGHPAPVALLIGADGGDGSLMGGSADFAHVFPKLSQTDLTALRASYGAEAASDADFAALLFRDGYFAGPSLYIAAHNAAPAYVFRFDYVASMLRLRRPNAQHGSEIPYVFETGEAFFVGADQETIGDVHDCWAAFARTGAPACSRIPHWPRYRASDPRLLAFGATPTVQPVAHGDAFALLQQRLAPSALH